MTNFLSTYCINNNTFRRPSPDRHWWLQYVGPPLFPIQILIVGKIHSVGRHPINTVGYTVPVHVVDSNGMLRPVSQICLGVSTERNEEIREEATALGIGWGKGEGSKIGATTSEEEKALEKDILSSQVGAADEKVLAEGDCPG